MRYTRSACTVAPMDSTDPPGSYLTPSFEHARVADAMRPRVLTCDPGTLLVAVAQRMASEHVHAIVVLLETVNPDGEVARRPWAVVTDHDVLRSAASIAAPDRGRRRDGRGPPRPSRRAPARRRAAYARARHEPRGRGRAPHGAPRRSALDARHRRHPRLGPRLSQAHVPSDRVCGELRSPGRGGSGCPRVPGRAEWGMFPRSGGRICPSGLASMALAVPAAPRSAPRMSAAPQSSGPASTT